MLLEIPELLNSAQLEKIHQTLEGADFIDGTRSAGLAAARVKHNQELAAQPKRQELLARILMASLGEHPAFRFGALPHRVAEFIIARYQPGMTYGAHIDDPVMGANGPRFRTDVSLTVFLNAPEGYDGGELTIRTSFGERQVKLPAGHAVLYPSSSLHWIAPVTRGERLVALTWVQSYVRDPARRELLYELNQAREYLLTQAPEAEHTAQVDRSYNNLLRLWAEL